MPKWPIRVKLIAGLSLVVGMMLILMGGAIFSLSAFHASNLMHTDLLRELGASKELIKQVVRPRGPSRRRRPRKRRQLQARRPRRPQGPRGLLRRAAEERDPPEPASTTA